MCGFSPCVLRHSDKQIEKLSEGLTTTQDPAPAPASALASTALWLQESPGLRAFSLTRLRVSQPPFKRKPGKADTEFSSRASLSPGTL